MITFATDRLRRSDRLVVAFGGVRQRLRPPPKEFSRSLEQQDCAVLFVRDPQRWWWQYDGGQISSVLDRIRTAREETGAKRLICLGNSMGGFGALYFGARLGADAILGFSPQTA